MYDQIISNKRKTILLVTLVASFVIALGWFLSWQYNNPAILFLAVIISFSQTLASYYYSDKMALMSTGARLAPYQDFLALHRLVENLAITAGVPKPKVYIIPNQGLNAFATGRDPEHASIAVTAGLLEKLTKPQLEGVISHELSHIKNYDIRVMTMVVILIGIISLASNFFLRWQFWGGGRERGEGGSGNQIIALLGFVFIILSPITAMLIQLAISRKREYLADASGALLTRYPEGLASALEVISKNARPISGVSSATAHLFIANPFTKQNVSSLFSTHPPIKDRIKKLREMV
ncbi:zinc metalloprotease HtpX [Candidatus Berkelbacteria bacterium CG_4_9_14_3_um_filter_39_23]|uniref:Protease HtpX homolog n=1 Tax=Candidatus Berkelbacteria bacterium CG_4_9_14_3_um_filter_39_23 TaxID=1974508 RepID=A0A2M8C661_9BACT|nr:MAG: zinc metalloprotease HtpX [Candidatus Berkelbacteria bacterium CG2_30_39_44]PIX30680.1 MAG: zinc metalloprotease HtpX [Candidatus Berkelbacteria bacterium CG_4_8_14_3_um_filter_39_27]PIZ28509.1 MAG: zinc metalloprotease HtpX [Candidatus Berkelbacteria bacterium CG_4_10_14_0_8_um_filter_39_42]PJB51739.1 MAG: zinc metalloprotease HtpX [Candidatus Berkelbacteria bacterium CG_4_9_14_3_um_filter_39_23]